MSEGVAPEGLGGKAKSLTERAVTIGGAALIGAGAGTLLLAAFGYWRAQRAAKKQARAPD